MTMRSPKHQMRCTLLWMVCISVHAALAFVPAVAPTFQLWKANLGGGLVISPFRAGRSGSLWPRMSANWAESQGPMAPDIQQLESTTPPSPHRTITESGFRAPEQSRSWPAFVYASAAERRARTTAIREAIYERSMIEQEEAGVRAPEDGSTSLPPALPMIKIVIIGGPCSGKGTIAPLISQATLAPVVSIGQLLRAEVRSGTQRGQQVQAVMERGDLLDDALVLDLVRERVLGSWDAQRNGWQLVGFPRTASQARAIASGRAGGGDGSDAAGLRPDCVVVLERPDDLCREFALGRMTDSATGRIYHPEFAPVPHDVAAQKKNRIVWRADDTPEVIDRRIEGYRANLDGILREFGDAGVPVKAFDNARSELETLGEVADFCEDVARAKLKREGGWPRVWRERYGDAAGGDQSDVDPLCDLSTLTTRDSKCGGSWDNSAGGTTLGGATASPYLTAVRRCNTFVARDFVPVLVGDIQVGWAAKSLIESLAPHLLQGRAIELVDLEPDATPDSVSLGAEAAGAAGKFPQKLRIAGHGQALRLAPGEATVDSRTASMAALVEEMVEDGVIPAKAIRRELQDVRPLALGFVGGAAGKEIPPLLRLERGAMIYFGVPSYGVHVNGYVAGEQSGRPESIWIAKRSMSKATYPGMYDQVVAGGQPAGLSFAENCAKECEEEASFPAEVVSRLVSTGLISYKYKTRKGLSTKILATFDCAMPPDLVPVCGDGEVEDFRLWRIEEALDSIKTELPLWKPNSALVLVDFAMRHGFISPDEPGYAEICHLLRAGLSIDDLRSRF